MSLGVIPLPDRQERIDGFVLKSSYDRLQAENAKLRELVLDMRVCLEDECERCHDLSDSCDLESRMRELGIEVDEWAKF